MKRNNQASGIEYRAYTLPGLTVRRDGDRAIIAGYAAVFNQMSVMLWGFREEILKGAFVESIEKNDIRGLWQHETDQVLGRTKNGTLRLWEDEKGLSFELEPPDTTLGRDAVTTIERGDVDQMSFGFRSLPDGDEWRFGEDETLIRTLKRVDLLEISPVTWAAYPQTSVGVRSLPNFESLPDWVQRALIQAADDSADDAARARLDLMRRKLRVFSLED